jgi:general secretion pathway protein D
VLLDDGEIIVIGGLIQDSANDGIQKVPLLGDLPYVGGLFQYRTRDRTKTNLMVFLRPTILREPQRAEPIFRERYDYIIGEQERTRPTPHPALPEIEWPALPLRGSPELRSLPGSL